MYSIYGTSSPHNAGIHTNQFREQAATDEAFDRAITVAKAMALVGADVVLDEQFREIVASEFQKSLV